MKDANEKYSFIHLFIQQIITGNLLCIVKWKSLKLFLTWDPGWQPPGLCHWIFRARILSGKYSSSGDLTDPGTKPASPELTGRFLLSECPLCITDCAKLWRWRDECDIYLPSLRCSWLLNMRQGHGKQIRTQWWFDPTLCNVQILYRSRCNWHIGEREADMASLERC